MRHSQRKGSNSGVWVTVFLFPCTAHSAERLSAPAACTTTTRTNPIKLHPFSWRQRRLDRTLREFTVRWRLNWTFSKRSLMISTIGQLRQVRSLQKPQLLSIASINPYMSLWSWNKRSRSKCWWINRKMPFNSIGSFSEKYLNSKSIWVKNTKHMPTQRSKMSY